MTCSLHVSDVCPEFLVGVRESEYLMLLEAVDTRTHPVCKSLPLLSELQQSALYHFLVEHKLLLNPQNGSLARESPLVLSISPLPAQPRRQ